MSRTTPQVSGQTVDISPGGISLMLPRHLNPGDQYVISFDTAVDGSEVSVNAAATLIYSIFVGTTGFRTGFQFGALDGNTSQLIRKLSEPS